MFDKGSASIPRIVEDLLVRENIMLSSRAERFAKKVNDHLSRSQFLELYNGTTFTRYGHPGRGGLGTSIPGVVRSLLVEEGLMPYQDAVRFSEAVDRRLYGHNPLRLWDGTHYYLRYEVPPSLDHGHVASFIPAHRSAPLREYGRLNRRAIKARLSRYASLRLLCRLILPPIPVSN